MKIFTGKVISKSMQKTANVAVERVNVHPLYGKRVKRIKKYHVHDELGADVGQVVRFVGTRPFSKTKKWKVIEIVGGGADEKIAIQKTQRNVKTIKKVNIERSTKSQKVRK